MHVVQNPGGTIYGEGIFTLHMHITMYNSSYRDFCAKGLGSFGFLQRNSLPSREFRDIMLPRLPRLFLRCAAKSGVGRSL
eukprot:2887081-Amphidinium_carterae.1